MLVIFVIALSLVFNLISSREEEVKQSGELHRISVFGVKWELQEVEWRKAEGLYALYSNLVPISGSGRLPDKAEDVGNAFCGNVLSSLPADSPVADRNEIFRVSFSLPTLSENGITPEFITYVDAGACKTIAEGKWTKMAYPGLYPDWLLFEWKADNAALDDFRVVFRRTADQPLKSINLEIACRAALFDLPRILAEHKVAFEKLRSIKITAEAGVGRGFFKASRSLSWSVPIGPAGCGQAEEFKI